MGKAEQLYAYHFPQDERVAPPTDTSAEADIVLTDEVKAHWDIAREGLEMVAGLTGRGLVERTLTSIKEVHRGETAKRNRRGI